MKISHIKKETDGVLENIIHITYKDNRWQNSESIIELSLEEANLLLSNLSKKLSEIPY